MSDRGLCRFPPMQLWHTMSSQLASCLDILRMDFLSFQRNPNDFFLQHHPHNYKTLQQQ